ncbi:hypothetical protein FC50_GL001405 [Lacticaseibacillus pantheris DSM 15945 = JCM 12539 = NBRC 106106]|uniref:Uncharacterized protein n=1 Tax=Lacticaseibacillus pantheris DSM 15945 = JCM 12539 = NBRC 106106 TaxID=1423783 RepID=A0A0R1TZ35_9LACO|nr:hypothetical protein [Lacticaseibacillus pantheris]KRL85998.1 hypothetical protein FC50_GL001405 [Lacticaseibacillus pantheris DSM 15945 = JCM 12539 = NBRC 106106]
MLYGWWWWAGAGKAVVGLRLCEPLRHDRFWGETSNSQSTRVSGATWSLPAKYGQSVSKLVAF